MRRRSLTQALSASLGGVGASWLCESWRRRRGAQCEAFQWKGEDGLPLEDQVRAAASGARGSAGRGGGFALESAARCVSKSRPRWRLPPAVRHDCGDDAFFLIRSAQTASSTIGIADGVSSWNRLGVDPAIFAWELMRCCQLAAERGAHGGAPPCPRSTLVHGYEDMMSGGPPVGSSTACIAALDRANGRMSVANLGDSGALLVRAGGAAERKERRSDSSNGAEDEMVVLETQEQQHFFNCPYQLMATPRGDDTRGDTPQSSELYTVQAEPGDLLVLATDGFFDNVWRQQILELLSAMANQPPGEIAGALVGMAYNMSHSAEPSPFSVAATRSGIRYDGGKPDDITVVVARVVRGAP